MSNQSLDPLVSENNFAPLVVDQHALSFMVFEHFCLDQLIDSQTYECLNQLIDGQGHEPLNRLINDQGLDFQD